MVFETVLLVSSLLLVGSTTVKALPGCLPPVAIASADIVGVEPTGAMVLKDRGSVELQKLLLPSAEHGHASPDLERQIGTALGLLKGQKVTLRATAPKLDRYGRLRAQVLLSTGEWLQRDFVLRGLARVQIAPDRPECAPELYSAEADARKARRGLWALPQYAVRASESLRWRDLGSFQIVEGTVLNVKVSGRAYLNFGRNWRTDFTITISPDDMKIFCRKGVDPSSYTGKRVRVRGVVDRMNGYEIEVGSPEAIEVLSSDPRQ
jgi:hypothetical protein